MFGKRKKAPPESEANARGRVAEVGWLIDTDTPGFLYSAPTQLLRRESAPEHAKAVGHCPAILDLEARTFEVSCPFDLHLRLVRDEKGAYSLVNVAGVASAVVSGKIPKLIVLMAENRWRDPKRPVLQVTAPYRFISDEICYINQLPPFFCYKSPPWPGVLIGGRFPIQDWPRSLMWAFEWHDTARDLILRRGEPWFYVRFELEDPSRSLRLFEAEMTQELREYCRGLDGITNYANKTFSLMGSAKERRPAKLLVRKERNKPGSMTPPSGSLDPH